jgi:hypothetical protein
VNRSLGAPPLGIILCSILLSVIILAALILTVLPDIKKDEEEKILTIGRTFEEINQSRSADSDSGIFTIMIGSSLLKSATKDIEEIRELSREFPAPKLLHFSKIYFAAPRLSAFVWKHTLEVAMDAKPDVIVLEKTALLFQPQRFKIIRHYTRTLIKETMMSIFSGIRPTNHPGVAAVLKAGSLPKPLTLGNGADTFKQQALSNNTWRLILRFGLRPGFENFLRKCHQKGIQVIVTDVPFYPSFPARTTNREQATINMRFEKLQRDQLLQTLPCPLVFIADDYTDGRHMNSNGSRKYSTWIVNQLLK